jgi:outer membrane protein insertion porin family
VASKFKIGYLQVYSGTFAGVPLNRTFYAGGSNSIRGWLPNELVPVGSQYVRDISGINIVKGGTFLVEGSFELRRKFSDNFGSAVFMDYGNTWLGYNQFRFDGVAVAAGFGFRLYTPVAPIRIDLGLKFYDPSIGQFIWESWNKRFFKNITLHFGLGEAF